MKRLFGCMMLVVMPEEGVEEALTSLREIYEFRSARVLALTPPSRLPRIEGKVTANSYRPQLVISE